jgi:hypothetical protein
MSNVLFLFCLVFDKDMSGFVSSSELKYVMSHLGVNFTDEELLEMMIEVSDILCKLYSALHHAICHESSWGQLY